MFKKLSTKITFIISATAIIVGAIVAVYMQTRIITEIGTHTTMGLEKQVLLLKLDCLSLSDAIHTDGGYVTVEHLGNVAAAVRVYDTGFALLQDSSGAFFESNDIVRKFAQSDRDALARAAADASEEAFSLKLGGVDYMAAAGSLLDEYTLYVLAPTREVNAELYASLTRFVIIFTVAFMLVIVISYFVAKPIAVPLLAVSKILRGVASTGNLKLEQDDIKAIEELSKLKDESGRIVEDAAAFIDHVVDISEVLEVMASGDLTCEVKLKSDKDTMGLALSHMIGNLNNVFAEINATTVEVSIESKNIADDAQALAQGSTEQAASVEQLSSSISEIAGKTHENAQLASKAAELSDSIRGGAEKGSQRMTEMIAAVDEINEASKSIGNIIKTIDDIAFQTNILALNAAVEAARAGQHGKGFAVVAEEVRNLASKSAEAAKDTGVMIQNSIEKAEYGSGIAGDTAASLNEIVNGINETTQLVSEIARASEEQSMGISQINVGIDQVAQVVSQNSATAQQSAQVSEKLSGQSSVLEQLIAQFKINDTKGLPPRFRE